MTVLLQVLLLVLGMSHYSQGQTMLDCSLRPFCEDRNLTKGFINALSGNSHNFVQFDCYMTILLDVIHIVWFYQQFESGSIDPGNLNTIYSNVQGNNMFTTSVSVLDLKNFTFGPVRSRLVIRDVSGMYEGTYSCAEADKDVSTRQYEGCLFVLGQGVFKSCSDSLVGCHNSSQAVKLGDKAVLDVRVVFRGGGDCAHQAVTYLTVTKDSKVVYSCQGTEDKCTNEKYPKFEVLSGLDCDVDCKYYINLVLLDFVESDVGAYTAEVLLHGAGNTQDRKINKTFVLKADHSDVHSENKGSVSISAIFGPALSAIVALTVGCVLIFTTVLIVKWRKNRTASKGHGRGVYGTLPDLDELKIAAMADLEGSSSGYELDILVKNNNY